MTTRPTQKKVIATMIEVSSIVMECGMFVTKVMVSVDSEGVWFWE